MTLITVRQFVENKKIVENDVVAENIARYHSDVDGGVIHLLDGNEIEVEESREQIREKIIEAERAGEA